MHSTHEDIDYANSINVFVLKVPPHYINVCQLLNVAWNQPFKSQLRPHWVKCLRSQIAAHHARDRSRADQQRNVSEQVAVIARTE
ncbi:hypothetical protein PHMEG_00013078 [Phytophthora megakarya]|uniref:Uncharacterized protein n=1 Tax=Phytophthora megakarya TaxID=4795 RepID=A0A225W7L6_9STRA|nr:hypothetical protein PHMEG_00013078 [Phytophthora megakarya]